MEMNEKYTEMFEEAFNNLDTWEQVAINNDYVNNGGYGHEILQNSEEDINQYFSSPYDALMAVNDYNPNDEYMWVNGLGELNSGSNFSDIDFASIEEMAEYYYFRPTYLKDFKDFNEWYEAVEYGIDEEDDE